MGVDTVEMNGGGFSNAVKEGQTVKKSTDGLGGLGQQALEKIERCSKPVIAAVNGFAFGGGCDFRVVSETPCSPCRKRAWAGPRT